MAKSLKKYLYLSLIIHAVVVMLSQLKSPTSEPFAPENPTTVLEWVELAPQEAIRGLIVDQDEMGPETKEPIESEYLGRRNQRVQEETRAAPTGRFQNAAAEASSPAAPGTAAEELVKKAPPLEPGGFFPSARSAFREMAQRQVVESSSESDTLQSQTSDHLKDLAISSQTHLNTREYIYYNYFSRIKERILQHWEPSIKKKITQMIYQGRYLASTGDRTTHLMITLNDKGQLVRVQVKSPSGVRDLDEEAVKAFEAAAPFPNPPQGLVERDGTIQLDWRFIIEA